MRGELRLQDLAARQHGTFSRSQAIECGLRYDAIHYRVASGEWLALDDSVYAYRSSPLTWERRLQAAILSRPIALAAGRSAGFLHGFSGYGRTKPEILVPFDGNARSDIARVIRSRHFDRISYANVKGFPATTIAETVLTLSYRELPTTLERIVDEQLAAGRLQIESFYPVLERLEGARMRGLGTLRRIVAERDADAYHPPTSELERLLYSLLDDWRLPPFDRQSPLPFQSGRAFVDAFIPTWGMVVEADGRRWHTRFQDFEIDRRRNNDAAAAGFVVIRFTYRMLTQEQSQCLETLLEAGKWRHSA